MKNIITLRLLLVVALFTSLTGCKKSSSQETLQEVPVGKLTPNKVVFNTIQTSKIKKRPQG